MEEKKNFFGYSKDAVLQNFRECNDQVDSNGRIGEESTLVQLSETSKRMIIENADFLYSIYNELDD